MMRLKSMLPGCDVQNLPRPTITSNREGTIDDADGGLFVFLFFSLLLLLLFMVVVGCLFIDWCVAFCVVGKEIVRHNGH